MESSSSILEEIGSDKILWIGQYPAHYVRKMHLALEAGRPGVMHFVYIANTAGDSERDYERGVLPASSIVIENTFSSRRFLEFLQNSCPRAIIVTGYSHRLLKFTLLWCYWKRMKFSFWCDTNILIAFGNNMFRRFFKKLILNLILARAHKILFIGTRNRDFHISLLGFRLAIEKLFFLPYPAIITESSYTAPHNLERTGSLGVKNLKILYLGRLEPIKSVHKLLLALAFLPATTREHVHLDIYGDGSEKNRLMGIVAEHCISGLVTFHGPIASDQVAQAYAEADLFVLPSEEEPWGLVVNEALLAAIPVMCPFWVGAAADLITDGETGYILDNNSPACIAAGIERAFQMGDRNKQLGLQGRTRVTAGGWNVDAASAQLVTLVDEVSCQSK